MNLSYLTSEAVRQFIENALREDVGDGDHSSLASVPATAAGQARLLIKDTGILAGVELAPTIFHAVDPAGSRYKDRRRSPGEARRHRPYRKGKGAVYFNG